MSDWIEYDGKKYFKASCLELANNNIRRRDERIAALEAAIESEGEAWRKRLDLAIQVSEVAEFKRCEAEARAKQIQASSLGAGLTRMAGRLVAKNKQLRAERDSLLGQLDMAESALETVLDSLKRLVTIAQVPLATVERLLRQDAARRDE